LVIGALVNADYPEADLQVRQLQDAAGTIGLQIHAVTTDTERGIDAAFAALVEKGTDALVVANGPFFASGRDQIVSLSARHTVPAIDPVREDVAAGGPWPAMGQTSPTCFAKLAFAPVASLKVPRQPIFQSCSRRNSP
jgi:ABC-type uncharacterized transport system substrate-binding protein